MSLNFRSLNKAHKRNSALNRAADYGKWEREMRGKLKGEGYVRNSLNTLADRLAWACARKWSRS